MEEKKKSFQWKPATALALCLALTAGLLWFNIGLPIPKYENALFTAEQIGEMFPKTLGGTNVYKKVGFPAESLFIVPDIPQADTINIYKRTYYADPSKEAVQAIMDDIFPLLESMYDIDIPALTIEENESWYVASTDADGIRIYASSSVHDDSVHWYGSGLAPLVFEGEPLYLNVWQSDNEIMQSLSSAISYLEQTFDMDLSAHRIYRSYSNYESSLDRVIVYLYSADHEADDFLKRYDDYPSYYCSGEMLQLIFEGANQYEKNDTVKCTEMEYTKKPQPLYEIHTQCRMLTLREAEHLLNQGSVFSFHSCPICLRNQAQVDFTHYDRVSLEYVYERKYGGYAVPFYTFYKKIKEENGFVQYAKTMVPAIEVSGLKEYFEEQKEYHKDNTL